MTKEENQKTFSVVKQEWWESESGWGQRPDGYSIHLNKIDRDQYIKEYWDRRPKKVPHEYSRPSGDPTTMEVDESTFNSLKRRKNGIRYYQ